MHPAWAVEPFIDSPGLTPRRAARSALSSRISRLSKQSRFGTVKSSMANFSAPRAALAPIRVQKEVTSQVEEDDMVRFKNRLL